MLLVLFFLYSHSFHLTRVNASHFLFFFVCMCFNSLTLFILASMRTREKYNTYQIVLLENQTYCDSRSFRLSTIIYQVVAIASETIVCVRRKTEMVDGLLTFLFLCIFV